MAKAVQAAGNPRVAAYIAAQPRPLKDVLAAGAALLDAGLPGATCAIKWDVPVWSGNGNVAALMTYPDRVHLAFFQGARLPDPRRRLEGTGKGMRHLKVAAAHELKDPDVKALVRNAWRLDQA